MLTQRGVERTSVVLTVVSRAQSLLVDAPSGQQCLHDLESDLTNQTLNQKLLVAAQVRPVAAQDSGEQSRHPIQGVGCEYSVSGMLPLGTSPNVSSLQQTASRAQRIALCCVYLHPPPHCPNVANPYHPTLLNFLPSHFDHIDQAFVSSVSLRRETFVRPSRCFL
jgi:hypothetical protein